MNELEQAKAKAAFTYNTAADYFDHPVGSFWHCFGRQTVERIGLQPGESVLDVCSGSGSSALPAAELVGPGGRVVATDLAERLVELAQAKAEAKGLNNIEFRVADMLDLGYADASFDTVICVFGIFFVPDMVAAVKELWRMVRPGGRLVITTWGPGLFEPASSAFWDVIAELRPDLKRTFSPWERICEPARLKAMLAEAGVHADDVVAEPGSYPLSTPEDWWTIAMGSGYRGTLALLDEDTFAQVRERNLSRLASNGVDTITANVIYAVATKGHKSR